jgi:hypothetical protein
MSKHIKGETTPEGKIVSKIKCGNFSHLQSKWSKTVRQFRNKENLGEDARGWIFRRKTWKKTYIR